MKTKIHIIAIIMLCILCACTTLTITDKDKANCDTWTKSWVGLTHHALIMKLGNSQYDEQPDGAGGKIVTYLHNGIIDEYGYKQMLYGQFYINSKGIIYHVRCFVGS